MLYFFLGNFILDSIPSRIRRYKKIGIERLRLEIADGIFWV